MLFFKMISLIFVWSVFSAQSEKVQNTAKPTVQKKFIKAYYKSNRQKKMKNTIIYKKQAWAKNSKDIKKRPTSMFAAEESDRIRKRAKRVVQEISQHKTVRDWINKGSIKHKLFRRQHFSKYMDQPTPKVIAGRNRVLIYVKGPKKNADVISFIASPNGVQTYYNAKNISAKKGEGVEQWYQRLYGSQNRNAQSWWIQKAYAQPPLNPWETMIGSMAAGDWLNRDGEDGLVETIMDEAQLLMQNNGLQCNAGEASFRTNIGYTNQLVAASRSLDNDGYLNLRFDYGNPSNRNQPNFHIEYRPNNEMFFLRSHALPSGEVSGQQFLPNLAGMLSSSGKTFGDPPTGDANEFIQNDIAATVCTALAQNNIKACEKKTTSASYLECVNSDVMGAKLETTISFNNPLYSLDYQAGVALKAQLSSLLSPGITLIPQPNIYPALDPNQYNSVAVPIPFQTQSGMTAETLTQQFLQGLSYEDGLISSANPRDVEFKTCVESLASNYSLTPACSKYANSVPPEQRDQTINAIWQMAEAFANIRNEGYVRSPRDLRHRNNESPTDPGCAARFGGEAQNQSLNYYADLDMVTGFPDLPQQLDQLVGIADVARACCSNRACEAFTKGKYQRPNSQGVGTESSN